MKVPNLTDQQLKVLGWAVGTIGIGIIIYLTLKKFGIIGGKASDAQSAVDKTLVNKSNLSVAESDLLYKTDQLYEAMDQFGTDEDTIMSVFNSLKTLDDFNYILKAFGVKKYFLTGHGAFLGDDLNLIGWLQAELSDDYMTQVKTIINKLGSNIL
jgi:hypothetical protein